jgi:hypothetical protein
MTMKRLLFALALLALPVAAQPPERVVKLIQLKYADPNAVNNLIQVFGAGVTVDRQMKIIGLSGTRDQVAATEAAIKQLDVPTKNVELTVYFVTGSDSETQRGNAVPADLQPVVTQLKNVFAFKNYRLLDVLTLRTRTASTADTSGILSTANFPATSSFRIQSSSVAEDGTIRIEGMHAGLRVPIAPGGKPEYANSGIDQNIDVKEGQKVVVGRTSLEGPDKALFIVLMGKVLQ